ncbi:MAG: glycoside hydrolase family 3 C-terminal domain-containing protein [Chloroflexi bacterium]|nr:glycoside hydrolase family 3 C-terminal domain-containing protein [Chloroflexota bacterium]
MAGSSQSETPPQSFSFDDARRRVAAGEDAAAVARAFVAGLTVDEKLWCMDGDEEFWPGLLRMAGRAAATVAGDGYSGRPWAGAQLPRAGFPGITFSDGPRGVVIGANTCFPVAMARGATWDPDLEERIGVAIGLELRASGANLFGGVNVNVLRHPAWGRAQETYGEDPHHIGEMGAALARGVQRHAMACVKHFALNSIDNARFKVDVQADDRTLHEVYLPHFKRVVDEGVACVMSAYNSVNGAWCGENRVLLTEILRDQWGFRGLVISDWIFGLRNAVQSVLAGLDIEMPFRQQRMMHLPRALADGTLSEGDIDRPVAHVVETLLRFDDVLSRPAPDASIAASPEHRALAYEAAAKSIVLLKNGAEGAPLLPLDASRLKRIAVLGRLASITNLGDRGSSNVIPPSAVTPLDGLRAALPDAEVLVADGSDLDEVGRIARDADAVIVVVGCTFEDEGEYISAQPELLMATAPPRPERLPTPDPPRPPRPEAPQGGQRGFATGGDRASLDLSAADQALIQAAAAANPATVVVMMGGSAILVEGWHEAVPAILMLWYPGMEGGRALADVLLGRVNPTGRLPFTVPRDAGHLPYFDREATSITYDLFHGQWLLDRDGHEARYPFGFGLSYGPPAVVQDVAADAGKAGVSVSARLVSHGAHDATEVVQVYAGARGSRLERPPWRLAAFARTVAPAGGSATVRLSIPYERLAVRIDGAWVVEGGAYDIAVGRHAHDPRAIAVRIDLRERRLGA